jgi:hypothetical protein
MPVRCVMRSHRRRSASKPSHPDEVPLPHIDLRVSEQFGGRENLDVVELFESLG